MASGAPPLSSGLRAALPRYPPPRPHLIAPFPAESDLLPVVLGLLCVCVSYILVRQLALERLNGADGVTSQSVSQRGQSVSAPLASPSQSVSLSDSSSFPTSFLSLTSLPGQWPLPASPADHGPAQYQYMFLRQLALERLNGADGVTSQSVSQRGQSVSAPLASPSQSVSLSDSSSFPTSFLSLTSLPGQWPLPASPADHGPAQYHYMFLRQLALERLSGADGVTSQSVSQPPSQSVCSDGVTSQSVSQSVDALVNCNTSLFGTV